MVGYRTNERGAVEPIEEWRAELAAARRGPGRTGVSGWAVDDRDTRPINPFTRVTRDEYIRRQLAIGGSDALREARRLFPWDTRVSDKGVIR